MYFMSSGVGVPQVPKRWYDNCGKACSFWSKRVPWIYDHCNDQGVEPVQRRLFIVTHNSWRYGLSLNPPRKQVRYCAPHAGLIIIITFVRMDPAVGNIVVVSDPPKSLAWTTRCSLQNFQKYVLKTVGTILHETIWDTKNCKEIIILPHHRVPILDPDPQLPFVVLECDIRYQWL